MLWGERGGDHQHPHLLLKVAIASQPAARVPHAPPAHKGSGFPEGPAVYRE